MNRLICWVKEVKYPKAAYTSITLAVIVTAFIIVLFAVHPVEKSGFTQLTDKWLEKLFGSFR